MVNPVDKSALKGKLWDGQGGGHVPKTGSSHLSRVDGLLKKAINPDELKCREKGDAPIEFPHKASEDVKKNSRE